MAALASGAGLLREGRCSPQQHPMKGAGEKGTMDELVFRSDSVLSDVHLHTPRKRHLMVRLNAAGQPVFLSQIKLLLDKSKLSSEKKERDCKSTGHQNKYVERINTEMSPDSQETLTITEQEEMTALLDEDGDLQVVRKPQLPSAEAEDCQRGKVYPTILTRGGEVWEEEEEEEGNGFSTLVKIEHTLATPLEDVGKQVWRGAFLLADFILWKPDLFKDCTVLELGAGTGMVSIVVAEAARSIYCTDVGDDLLDMCERNVALNKHLTDPAGSKVKVRALDWLKDDFCMDSGHRYSWSEKEIAELYDLTTVILAADVFYDDDLTNAFFRTLYRITHNLKNPCTVFLSIEKRFNFTLRHMEVACEAYSHFRETLNDLVNIKDGKMAYTMESLPLSFPQHLIYERVEELELWKITADVASERSRSPQD